MEKDLLEEIKKIPKPGENALETEHKEYFFKVYQTVCKVLGYDFFQELQPPTIIKFRIMNSPNPIELKPQ